VRGFRLAPTQVCRTAYIHVERNVVIVSWNHTDRSPSQAKPSQAKPSQAKPSQAKPNQTKPSQAKLSQAKPSQAKPSLSIYWGEGGGELRKAQVDDPLSVSHSYV